MLRSLRDDCASSAWQMASISFCCAMRPNGRAALAAEARIRVRAASFWNHMSSLRGSAATKQSRLSRIKTSTDCLACALRGNPDEALRSLVWIASSLRSLAMTERESEKPRVSSCLAPLTRSRGDRGGGSPPVRAWRFRIPLSCRRRPPRSAGRCGPPSLAGGIAPRLWERRDIRPYWR
jgi:hypothetical protein